MIPIDEENNIYYDETKSFSEQSEEFQEYANKKYSEQVTAQVTSIGYPKFNKDGSLTFLINDDLLRAEVTRIQRYPNSTSDRSLKETKVKIFVK